MKVALLPDQPRPFVEAISLGGGIVSPLDSDVTALVWTDYHQPQLLRQTLEENPQLTWVQLPFAGVDAFADILKFPIRFTSAKGAYSEPVAEHALALSLALGRAIPERVRAKSWGGKFAVSLYESRVLIVGAGGIAKELIELLRPFGCPVDVVRHDAMVPLGNRTFGIEELDEVLPQADFVIVAAALTPETTGLFNLQRLQKMKTTAYLVNVARGKHVVTNDLVEALRAGVIAGAALDVTDPEPLPEGHELWEIENCIITPHTADTPEQVTRMFAQRIRQNVAAFVSEGEWVGVVDPVLGY